MIDHAKIARDLLKGSLSDAIADHPQAVEGMNAMVSRAHVEATLALVEQQRIANLIAYAAMLDQQYQMANERGEADVKFVADQGDLNASLARQHAAQVEVVAALGLNEGENDEV